MNNDKRALLAEHNEVEAEIHQETLKAIGYTVDRVQEAYRALSLAGTRTYDIALADINFQNSGKADASFGIQLHNALNCRPNNGGTRLILVCGDPLHQPYFEQQMAGKSNVEYHNKPVSLVAILGQSDQTS